MTIGRVSWNPPVRPAINSPHSMRVIGARQGVLLHFDASSSDAGALAWFRDPACKVSYNAIALDDGSYAMIASWDRTAYHAGECRPSSSRFKYEQLGTGSKHTANHAFFGIAAATNEKVDVTARQLITIAHLVRLCFEREKWPLEETWRITGHDAEAWPRGRKTDPTGPLKLNPILSVEDVRALVPLIQL